MGWFFQEIVVLVRLLIGQDGLMMRTEVFVG